MTDRQEQIRQIASSTDDELRALRGQLFDTTTETPDDDASRRSNRVIGEGHNPGSVRTDDDDLRDFATELFDL